MRSFSSAPPRAASRFPSEARKPGALAVRTVPIDLEHIQPTFAPVFDGPNAVYLSPHHDDVCFSLGALIRRRPGGRLISLFTRSGYSLTPPSGETPDIDAITARRIGEDDAFAAACHLNKIDLGLTDAPLLGRSPMDLSHVGDDVATLSQPLLSRLFAMARDVPASEKLTLFCPAGIGGHVNHVATMVTIVSAIPLLRRHYRIVFYEDLHYAARAASRPAGLARLASVLGSHRATRLVLGFAGHAEAKLALLRLYQSQFEALPEDCARYSPDTGSPVPILHEAVWDFATETAAVGPGIRTSTGERAAHQPAVIRPA